MPSHSLVYISHSVPLASKLDSLPQFALDLATTLSIVTCTIKATSLKSQVTSLAHLLFPCDPQVHLTLDPFPPNTTLSKFKVLSQP